MAMGQQSMLSALASQQAQAALAQGQKKSINALTGAYNTGRTDVTGAIPQQTGALQTGYNTATGAIQGGLNQSLSALGGGYNAATGALGTGYNTARGDIAGGVAAYDPYYQSGTAANSMYANALGLNGAEGNAAATNAFQASPGYDWARSQAVDAAARKANSLGMAASGNTLAALTSLGSNLANQEYGNYLNRLQGLGAQGMTAAGARMHGGMAQGDLANTYGLNTANLATDLGRSQANAYDAYGTRGADLATGLGTNTANVYGGSANTLANLAQGFGQNQANVYTTTAGNRANSLMQGTQLTNNAIANQQAPQQAAAQRPLLLASGVLGGLSGIGAGLAGNPSLFR